MVLKIFSQFHQNSSFVALNRKTKTNGKEFISNKKSYLPHEVVSDRLFLLTTKTVLYQLTNERKVMGKYLFIALTLWLGLIRPAMAEDPNDTYLYRSECPQVGPSLPADTFNFRKCQCTSYVAHKLNERWGNTSPQFTNQYYGLDRWGHAYEWLDRARSSQVEIGVTGARDNFVWEESKFNAVFVGDVALWERKGDGAYKYGHVAYVEAAGADVYGKGVAWVTISEYNFVNPGYEFSRRTLYKSDPKFPDYFLHIDKDRVYCKANPTVDTCATLMGGVATAGLSKYIGGLGGGGGSDPFNLKVNSFGVWNAAGSELVSGAGTLLPNQTVTVKVQVKAKDGNTSSHMRPGKDTVEVDLYARTDSNDWVFQRRAYIKAVNLPSGSTHTETLTYTIPRGISEVSFKAKIDAEDEAYEANEGDNWSEVKTFRVFNPALFQTILNLLLED